MTITTSQSRNLFATHGHHRLSYELITPDSTQPNNGTETVVLLHSLLAGRGEFAALRTLLSGRFRLILPDARGHGASAAIPDQRYSIQTAASELDAILDAAGESSVHLLGHGLGGAVAIAFATVRLQRVHTLTLIDPAVPNLLASHPDPVIAIAYDEAMRADNLAAATAYKGVTERAVDQYLVPRSGPDWRTNAPKHMVATIRRHGTALAGSLAALTSYTPDRDKLSALAVPTTTFTTATARPVTGYINQHFTDLVPRSTLVELLSGNPDDPLRSPLSGPAAATIADTLLSGSQRT